MSERELQEWVAQNLKDVQSGFDRTKTTFLTAGLFVVISAAPPEIQSVDVLGIQGSKLIAVLSIMAAITQLLSYVVAERLAKRMDMVVGRKILLTRTEELIVSFYTKDSLLQKSIVSKYFMRLLNSSITVFNNMATVFVISGLTVFLMLMLK